MLKMNKKIKNDKKPFLLEVTSPPGSYGRNMALGPFLVLVTVLELSMSLPYGLGGIKTLGDGFMIDNIWKKVQDAPKKKRSMLERRRRAE